jgi:hypothetical protein
MGNFLAVIFAIWFWTAVLSSPYFWLKRTNRSQAPVVRRFMALGYGFAWPYLVVKHFTGSQQALPAGRQPATPGPGASPLGASRPAPARKASSQGAGATIALAGGRRLRSSNSPQQCADLLTSIFEGYRPRRYRELPQLVPAGVRWLGREGSPAIALCGNDQADQWLLFTLAPVPGGTEIGVFGIGDIGQVSVIGHWKMRDSSLTSTGTWPARTVALTPPPVSDDIAATTLAANDYPVNEPNLQRMASILFDQFLAKAVTFVGGMQNDAAAKHFADTQRQQADYSSLAGPLRSVLRGLAEWDSDVLPYIQNLPQLAPAVLLHMARETGNGGVWATLTR